MDKTASPSRQQPAAESLLVPREEARRMLGLSRRVFDRVVKDGTLVPIHDGKRDRFLREDVQQWPRTMKECYLQQQERLQEEERRRAAEKAALEAARTRSGAAGGPGPTNGKWTSPFPALVEFADLQARRTQRSQRK